MNYLEHQNLIMLYLYSYSDDKILRITLKGKFKARFLIKVDITAISFRQG